MKEFDEVEALGGRKDEIIDKTEQDKVLEAEDLDVKSQPVDLPKLSPKPGYQTSQGQLTALFTVVSLILAAIFGWKISPYQISTWYGAIVAIVAIIGPLVANIPVLTNYINSRGKIQSNSLWASAAVNMNPSPENQLRAFGGWGKIVKGIGQGVKVGADLGIIPGGKLAKAGGEMAIAIGDSDDGRKISDEDIAKSFKTLGENDKYLNGKLDEILAKLDK